MVVREAADEIDKKASQRFQARGESAPMNRALAHKLLRTVLVAAASLAQSACATPPSCYGEPMRVIVRFQQPTAGDAETVVQQLSQISGARVSYAASISEDSHAYLLVCPSEDADCSQALQALARAPSILRVTPDTLKHSQP
jgi:hypothetical protein